MGRQHPNVLKLRKQSRMRRAWARPFNDIKVPRSVGTADIPEDQRAYFNYRQRGNTYWDDFFAGNCPTMLSKQRLEVIARAQELTKDLSPECNIIVHRGGITKTIIRWYFSADYEYCFFMKEDWLGMYMDKSEEYRKSRLDLRSAKDRAFDDYNNNRLKWVERISFPTVHSEPPSG